MTEYELVVLFADADAEKFVTNLITRGIERGCLRKVAWRSVRDPMHDARVVREPTAALAPFLGLTDCRFVIVVDRHGSGYESRSPARLESDVLDAMERASIARERVAVIVFEPELEAVLVPVWDRVLELLAGKRGASCLRVPPNVADPKAGLAAALHGYRLKAGSALFGELGAQLSLSKLKDGVALQRLAEQLVVWFGPSKAL